MKRFVVALLLVSLILLGCTQNIADVRSINSATPADSTQVVTDASRVVSLNSASGTETVVMAGSAADYPVGGHVILDNNVVAGGRLYRIESVQDNGDGTVTLACANGQLEDALKDANVSFSGAITPTDTNGTGELISYADGSSRAINFSQAFDIDLGSLNLVSKIMEWANYNANGSPIDPDDVVKLKIGGKMKITPTVNLDLQIENAKMKYAIIDLGAKLDTTLIFEGGVDFNWSQDIPLFKLNVGVITIMAGPVPIILQPQFDIILNVHAGVKATATLTVTQTTELRICSEKIGDAGWDTSKSKAYFGIPEFGGINPTITLYAGASLRQEVGICLYGIVGIQAKLTEFADFNAIILDGSKSMLDQNFELVPWEDLYTGTYWFEAGIAAEVGVRISAFGIINKDFKIWGDRWVLARWDLNKTTGYEKDPNTGMYGVWTFPAIQHLINK